MNARQRRKDSRRVARRAEGIHPDAFPAKCPITGRPYFMTLDHPELGMVPTYGGPYDSYTIPHAEGEASQPWHERELVQHRYDHDEGGWLLDVVETIPLRIIHDDVRDRLEDAEETLKALGYQYDGLHWKHALGMRVDAAPQSQPMPPRLLQSLVRRNFRAPTDMDDLIAMAANIIAEDGFVIERLQAKLASGVGEVHRG